VVGRAESRGWRRMAPRRFLKSSAGWRDAIRPSGCLETWKPSIALSSPRRGVAESSVRLFCPLVLPACSARLFFPPAARLYWFPAFTSGRNGSDTPMVPMSWCRCPNGADGPAAPSPDVAMLTSKASPSTFGHCWSPVYAKEDQPGRPLRLGDILAPGSSCSQSFGPFSFRKGF
jgi:hypothetical protein